MNPPPAALAMMGSGMEEDGGVDPRTQFLRSAILSQMQPDNTADHGPEGESGGEVGGRHIDLHGKSILESDPEGSAAAIGKDLPGFDQTGMPTTFAATPSKEAAASRLQKAESSSDVQPKSLKHKIADAFLGTIPIVGPAVLGVEGQTYRRGQRNIENARSDYETESRLEQGQREQSLRERVAMQNIEASKAMKELMVNMQNRRTDVNAGVRHEANSVSAAKGGYEIGQGPNGVETVTPRSDDQMSGVLQARMELQQAETEYKKAQTTAVPEQIEIRKKALDVAYDKLQLAIQNTQFNQDMRREGQDFRESGPTTQMRDRSQQSAVIQQTGDKLKTAINANKGVLGPVMGRYGSLADFVGNPPKGYAGLAAELTTYIALQPAAHGFRGMRAVQEFEKSIGTPIRTPEALIEAIGGNQEGLGPMSQAGGWTPLRRATPNVGQGQGQPAGRTLSLPRRGTPGGGRPASGAGSGGRSVVRGADGKLTFAPAAQAQ